MKKSLLTSHFPIKALLLAAALGAGCGGRECAEERENEWYSPLLQAPLGTDGAKAMSKRRQGEPIEILYITGGGQVGAFGAGFLNGWTRANGRPKFDIVAGVSIGAIIATFAFLGEPEDDARVKSAFLEITQDDIYESRGFPTVLFKNALNSTRPFQKTIDRLVPNELIDRVAAEGAAGRELWIGTLDLDRGAMAAWNLTEVAMEANRKRDNDLYDRYRTLLRASASVPVVFPPVMIDGAMHIDGSARELVFLAYILSPVCRVCADVAREKPDSPRPRLYALVNAKLGTGYECVAHDMKSIATRSVEVAIDEATLGALYRMQGLADRNHVEWRFTRIPQEEEVPRNHNAIEPDAMRGLFEAGYRRGLDPASWETEMPEPAEAPSK